MKTAPKEHAVFENVLKLFQLKAKQSLTLLELVRALAVENLKVESGRPVTIYDMEERLHLFIPWTFVSADKNMQKAAASRHNRAKFRQLKEHFEAIHKILNSAWYVPGESEKENDRSKIESVDQGPESSTQGVT